LFTNREDFSFSHQNTGIVYHSPLIHGQCHADIDDVGLWRDCGEQQEV
jgi:hypothetical protein